jgi:hypothetical protein
VTPGNHLPCERDDKQVVVVVVELHDHHQRHDVLHQVALVVNALKVLYPGPDVLNCSNLSPYNAGYQYSSKSLNCKEFILWGFEDVHIANTDPFEIP